jgi:hypothetical protein
MPKKSKISTSEATEIMALYFKLTGEKISTPEKLEQVYKVIQDYLKTKTPTIHF